MKRKIEVLLIVFVLILSLLSVVSNAVALSFTTTMTPSSTNVSEGTEVVVTVAVSNLNVGDSGINAFSAYLSYDSEVFETLTDSSVEGLNSWSSTYTTSSGQIFLTKNSFVNSEEDIMQINLKVKDGVSEGTEATVSLTGIVVQNSEDDISGDTVSTTITVGEETSTGNAIQIQPITNSANTTNETNTANEVTNSNTDNSSSYNVSNINTNSSDNNIPYTGPEGDAFIKIILGVVLVALAIYIKIRKFDDIK